MNSIANELRALASKMPALIDANRLHYAAEEIERLRAERDHARRELCDWCSIFTDYLPEDVAMKNGWDCYEEDGK